MTVPPDGPIVAGGAASSLLPPPHANSAAHSETAHADVKPLSLDRMFMMSVQSAQRKVSATLQLSMPLTVVIGTTESEPLAVP